jgi:hypothetical protein
LIAVWRDETSGGSDDATSNAIRAAIAGALLQVIVRVSRLA